jgi:nucleotide-binding universal stress UspA family protein
VIPIDLSEWRNTPCVRGRAATEQDVEEGRAVFAAGGEPVDLELPSCAIVTEEGIGEPTPVILIQAERLEDDTIAVGFRLVDGGSGIAVLEDVELLSEPDARFR